MHNLWYLSFNLIEVWWKINFIYKEVNALFIHIMSKLIHRYITEKLIFDYSFLHLFKSSYIKNISDEKYPTVIDNNVFNCLYLKSI